MKRMLTTKRWKNQAQQDRAIMPGAGDAAREEAYNDEHMTATPADKGTRSSEETR